MGNKIISNNEAQELVKRLVEIYEKKQILDEELMDIKSALYDFYSCEFTSLVKEMYNAGLRVGVNCRPDEYVTAASPEDIFVGRV